MPFITVLTVPMLTERLTSLVLKHIGSSQALCKVNNDFTDEETKSKRSNNLCKFIEVVTGRGEN